MRFDGKTALITGSSEGIGYAIAAALVAAGARVVLTARREAALESAVARLGSAASWVSGDISDPETARRAVDHALQTGDSLDLVVCNAGILIPGVVFAQPMAEVDRIIGVNLRGTIATVAAAVPALAKQPSSAIVVISSSIGRKPGPGTGIYGATKAALHYLVPTWASELGPMGIRVNGVCAGITETPGFRAGAAAIPGLEEGVLATNLIKRIATAEEVAGPVLTLLDSGSGGFVTGSVWDIDGGYGLGGQHG
ncbi:SDR family oxidoreductase [Nocardia sp. SYP-A9097]|uniref:SDR family NAD(P)-dependent oxidoreductase n=1 Tax=Nocardia sp. SYP-A9097 TaxID=2663237 RepID=UPI00129BFC7C|nr:SDR family oxidoreductase [Nocardia sp. SYP-A9097]MRH90097.1 SDR family oxidoreductase [Nocardia sp. SYP-A9097]